MFGAGLAEGPLGDVVEDLGDAIGTDIRDAVTRTGWESFEITDIVCALAAAVALVRGAVALLGESDNPAVPGSRLTLVLGAIALALVLYRVVNPPGIGQEREVGVWLGAVAAGGIVYGSYIAMQADRSENSRALG